ncbi:hypothetical protein Z962_07580 [Clostridium botulinum C/D str. BKT12695]|nr:hypothetical protein Z962_07580 [Clostridium botulinum C/D str. BKT12695]
MSQINEDKYILGQSTTGTVSSSNEEIQLNLGLNPNTASVSGGNITGTVTSGGNPVPGAYVKLMSSNYKPVMHAITDSQGQYSLTNVPVGSYTIFAIAPNMQLEQGTPVTVEQFGNYSQNLTLTKNPNTSLGVITGDLTNQTTGAAISGAVVSLFTSPGKVLTAVTYSNANGQYAFRTIQPGSYNIQISALGYSPVTKSVTVASNGGIQNINQSLTATPSSSNGTVSGIITDTSTNKPIPNADVILYSEDSSGNLTPVAFTNANANGVYLFGNVAPGKYKVKSNIVQSVTVK